MFKGSSFRRIAVPGAMCAIAIAAGAAAQTVQTAEKPVALYGVKGVSAAAVRQGYLGSCYFHAAVGALANAYPDAIRNAIREDAATDSFHVKFIEGSEETVYADDVAFAAEHNFDRSDGEWVRVLMRAYAQKLLRQSLSKAIDKSEEIPTLLKPAAHSAVEGSDLLLQAYDRAIRNVIAQNGTIDQTALKKKLNDEARTLGVPAASAQIVAGFLQEKGVFEMIAGTIQENGELFGAYRTFGQGGIPSRVFQALVGAGHTDFPSHREHIQAMLGRIKEGGIAMVADSVATEPADAHSWWVPSHAYTVIGYDAATDMVTLRNPWGEHPDPDGVFKLPFETFLKDFNIYSISTPDGQ